MPMPVATAVPFLATVSSLPSLTIVPSVTTTATNTRTASSTRTDTATRTNTRTPTNTRTNTSTRTATRTQTITSSRTYTVTVSATATRQPGTLVPVDMMGLVGRDPYFEVNNNLLNTQAIDQMGIEMAQLGVYWVRIDIRLPADYWASDAAVVTAISRYDYFINTVAPRHHINVLLLLNFDVIMGVDANELARGPYTTDLTYGPNYNKYMQVWMARAWQIIARYGTKISALEVLNEENRLPRYTSNGPVGNAVPASVVAQLTATLYRACRQGALQGYCATTPIILGGLHPRGSDAQGGIPAQTDMAYLAAIYASSAFQQAYSDLGRWPLDAVGYHSYPWELAYIGVRTQTQAYDRLRAQLIGLNDPLRPVWVTEIGYNVAYASQTENGQASFLGALYRLLAARLLPDKSREIPVVFWFKYEDFPPDTGSNAQKWGLVHIPFVMGNCTGGACYQRDGRPSNYRPAWYVYRDIH